jgi:Ca2+-binding EF-hand superfamily protein
LGLKEGATRAEVKELFNELDENGDGEFSKDEARIFLKNWLNI